MSGIRWADLHPQNQKVMVVLGLAFGGAFAVLALITTLVPGEHGFTARVVELSSTQACVLPTSRIQVESCYLKGGRDIEPAWTDLRLGSCVSMREREDGTTYIHDVYSPDSIC